jgi:predicted transglutaminase-like cysteine proteinase
VNFERFDLYAAVNRAVNQQIQYATDIDNYGIVEYWTRPKNGLGDCDDYTIEKRARLLAAGVPVEDLRIAFVEVPDVGFHVVLVATDPERGDWVLDNRSEHVVRFSETGYRLLSIQRGDQWEAGRIEEGGP